MIRLDLDKVSMEVTYRWGGNSADLLRGLTIPVRGLPLPSRDTGELTELEFKSLEFG